MESLEERPWGRESVRGMGMVGQGAATTKGFAPLVDFGVNIISLKALSGLSVRIRCRNPREMEHQVLLGAMWGREGQENKYRDTISIASLSGRLICSLA